MVDVPTWLETHFQQKDWVSVKMDVTPGEEFGLIRGILGGSNANNSIIDVLSLKCRFGRSCAKLTRYLKLRGVKTVLENIDMDISTRWEEGLPFSAQQKRLKLQIWPY